MWVNLDKDEINAIESGNKWVRGALATKLRAGEDLQNSAEMHAYRDAVHLRDGELELDEGAIVSKGDDPGAYVMTWIWVSDDELKQVAA